MIKVIQQKKSFGNIRLYDFLKNEIEFVLKEDLKSFRMRLKGWNHVSLHDLNNLLLSLCDLTEFNFCSSNRTDEILNGIIDNSISTLKSFH